MKPVSIDISFPKVEVALLDFWREKQIFKKSLGKKEDRKTYVFYDGPPFATGLPHYGHLLAGTIKDVIGRFFTMKGFYVDRRFGWDCHGLPVEFEIQKKLDLHGSKAIREFGVGKFNEQCREIVLRYTKEWERFVERSGRWVDFERQYRTMDLDFMESIWWVVKRLWDRGLVYEGFKCVPYSWAINTPLSNFEAALDYREIQDPAITVKVKLQTDSQTLAKQLGIAELPNLPVYAYIWTTTPWTLPSNLGLAVGPEIEYSLVANHTVKEIAIVATALVGEHFAQLKISNGHSNGHAKTPEESLEIVGQVQGSKLIGLQYEPIFSYFENEKDRGGFRIFSGDFVTASDGTGIVHLAAFGEEDVKVFQENNLPIIDPVDEDGNFTNQVPDFVGLNIKAAESKIISQLRQNGKLVLHKTIQHSYPFCWRTGTPLMYKTIPTWFVKVELLRDELLQMNSLIHWVPEHIKYGRFGKWLEGARDWAISRNRFWGTPLPVWRCENCKTTVCLGSVNDLQQKTKTKVTDLHSHFIDDLSFSCDQCKSGTMKRIPEVLDCWFESGSMPYAQAHYPFADKETFEKNFPADFIAEGLDQTRGWFYTLLVLSTALFGRPAFKNVIVNGIVLAEDGRKMSKSLRNFPPPEKILDEYGADAMRLYLLSSAATRAEELRFSENGVRDVVRQTLLPLWNAYNFFVTYALVDRWNAEMVTQGESNNLLDQWLLSKVSSLVKGVDGALSSYHLYAVAQPILDFVDQLTNWYIRLNRRRFWAGNTTEEKEDKLHAYTTLHRALLTFVRVLAPIAPFISEEIYLNLSRGVANLEAESVHLTTFPSLDEFNGFKIDPTLEMTMEFFEEVILLCRGVRNDHGLKVRQPLASLTIVHSSSEVLNNLMRFDTYIRDELNVKAVEYTTEEEKYVLLTAQLNTKELGKVLGPKLGSEKMKKLRLAVESLSTAQIRLLEKGERLKLEDQEISIADVIIRRLAKDGIKASASSGQITIVLDTALTKDLKIEGIAREFVNRIQKLRKDHAFEVTDRIIVKYMTACPFIQAALAAHREYVVQETLAVELNDVKNEKEFNLQGSSIRLPAAQEIEGKAIIISLSRIQG